MAEPAGLDEAQIAAIRAWDRPRYISALFAPPPLRADLLALYAFAAEIARIPDLVSDATLGEIRLQFWRDGVEALGRGSGKGGPPVLQALAGAIARYRLPLAPLLALVDARRADLYADPPASFGDVEGFLGETQSALFQMAALMAGSQGPETADLSGHAGVAYGLSRRLSVLAADRARGRTLLPLDLLAEKGLGPEAGLAASGHVLARVVDEMVGRGLDHLAAARQALRTAPGRLRHIYLPLALVEPLFTRIRRQGSAIVTAPVELSDLESLSRLAWARLRGP